MNGQTSLCSAHPIKSSDSEEQEVLESDLLLHDQDDDFALSYHAPVQSVADAEKQFDELTQEKRRVRK